VVSHMHALRLKRV